MMNVQSLRIASGFFAISCAVAVFTTHVRGALSSVPLALAARGLELPARPGDWRSVDAPANIVVPWVSDGGDAALRDVYDRVVTRTYERPDGAQVTLVIAYKRQLLQEDRIHRPEICYYAQGFQRSEGVERSLRLGQKEIRVSGFLATGAERSERVLYWIRSGSLIDEDPVNQRVQLIKDNFKGIVPDGVLVRASINSPNDGGASQMARENEILIQFFNDFLSHLSSNSRRILVDA